MLKKFVAIVLTAFVGFCACSKDDDDSSESSGLGNNGFNGQGGVSTFGQFAGQNETLLSTMLAPTDFSNIEDNYDDSWAASFPLNGYANRSVSSAFSYGGNMVHYFKSSPSGALSASETFFPATLLLSEMFKRVSIDTSDADYKDNETLEKCLNDLVKGLTITTVANEFLVTTSEAIDALPCIKDIVDATYWEPTKFQFQFAHYGQCYGTDLTEINGYTVQDVIDKEAHLGAAFCTYHSSAYEALIIDYGYTYTYAADNVYNWTHNIKYGKFDANGRSCQNFYKADNSVEFEDCSTYFMDTYSYTNANDAATTGTEKAFKRITSSGLTKGYGDNDWYTAGSWTMFYNGWAGTITNVNGSTTPAWVFTKTDEDNVEGNFDKAD